jgi:MraZ protein
MVPRFFGRYEHSLDVKGRVILPARFRSSFGPQAYLSKYQDRCLALWTPDEFEKRMAEMERMQEEGSAERNLARVWASGSAEVEIDRQGRVAIPGYLREFALLDGGVLVNGAINRIELWNPDEWQSRVQPAESQLTDDQADGSDGSRAAQPPAER